MNNNIFVNNQFENHIFPFTGVGTDMTEEILRERFQRLKSSGISSMVLLFERGRELQRFDEKWFSLLDRISKVCRELEMTYWIQDAAPFPTGAANGAFTEKEFEDLAKAYIIERHTQAVGPVKNATFLVENFQNANVYRGDVLLQIMAPERRERLLYAVMMKRGADGRYQNETAVDVTDKYNDGILQIDVPEGVWRIFLLFQTTEGGRPHYMNLIDRESVKVQIDKVHMPHIEHLRDEIGVTWSGFFYDEPEIGNVDNYDFHVLPGSVLQNGAPIPLPWCGELKDLLAKELGRNYSLLLPCLWYDCGEITRVVRYKYMDAVTRLLSENYNGQVYKFLKSYGVGYMGHTLEDENSHAHLGCGPGHYFRAQKYQDTAGVDIICGQMIPGADYMGFAQYGSFDSDGEFYHYGIAKLASSEGHINPLKRGYSVCEYMALYGNIGTLKYTKFIIDHLLVNGVGKLIPARSTRSDIGKEKLLSDYANRMCAVMDGSSHVATAAILYHAESEWAGEFQHFQRAGKELATHQIDYDVIPCDALTDREFYKTALAGGELVINDGRYGALIVPGCKYLPKDVVPFLLEASKAGVYVCFVDERPVGYCDVLGNIDSKVDDIPVIELTELAGELTKAGLHDIKTSHYEHFLRYNHFVKNGAHFYMLHNEEPSRSISVTVEFPLECPVMVFNAVDGELCACRSERVKGHTFIDVALGQFESKVYVFSDKLSAEREPVQSGETGLSNWKVTLYPGSREERTLELPGLTDLGALELFPRYNEKLIYETVFSVEKKGSLHLDLGRVCEDATVTLNGVNMGCRIASPYVFDLTEGVKIGDNTLVVEVCTNPARGPLLDSSLKRQAPVATSTYSVLEPVGMLGPVKLITIAE